MLFDIEDRFISLIAIALLVGFFGIVGWFVKEIDLMIVLALAVAMGVYDIYFYGRRRSSS